MSKPTKTGRRRKPVGYKPSPGPIVVATRRDPFGDPPMIVNNVGQSAQLRISGVTRVGRSGRLQLEPNWERSLIEATGRDFSTDELSRLGGVVMRYGASCAAIAEAESYEDIKQNLSRLLKSAEDINIILHEAQSRSDAVINTIRSANNLASIDPLPSAGNLEELSKIAIAFIKARREAGCGDPKEGWNQFVAAIREFCLIIGESVAVSKDTHKKSNAPHPSFVVRLVWSLLESLSGIPIKPASQAALATELSESFRAFRRSRPRPLATRKSQESGA